MRRPPSFAPSSAALLALPALLSACAAARDYPSLERRSAERQAGSGQPVTPVAPPPAPAPPSSDLVTRLAQLVDQARATHRRFMARRDEAARTVAAGDGAAPGSEAWSVATVALSDLESARSDAMIALAELDQLYAAEAVTASATGGSSSLAAIEAARAQVTALVAEEDAALTSLRGRMRG